jgi:hypothetical protein
MQRQRSRLLLVRLLMLLVLRRLGWVQCSS